MSVGMEKKKKEGLTFSSFLAKRRERARENGNRFFLCFPCAYFLLMTELVQRVEHLEKENKKLLKRMKVME